MFPTLAPFSTDARRSGRTTLRMTAPLFGPGVLHLQPSSAQSRAKMLQFCAQQGRVCHHEGAHLSLQVPDVDLRPLMLDLLDILSPHEQQTTRAIFARAGQEMRLNDYFSVDSLLNVACKVLCGWLIEAIENECLTTAFQPIVHVRQPNKVFAYECLLRMNSDGQVIAPNRLLDVARGAGLLFQLDLGARRTAIREAAKWDLDAKIFINFAPTALADPQYALQSTLQVLEEANLPREQIVFEVTENECIEDLEGLKRTLREYREHGFGIALDDLGSGYSSLNLLADLRPDFVKLDRDLMREVPSDPYRSLIAQKLLETAHALGISTIAEGVETAQQCAWLQEFGGQYAQGFHFARPKSVPPLSQHSPQPCLN